MTDLYRDVHYGLRLMGKRPGFTLAAVAILALGIASSTAMFSVMNAALLRPLPVEEPERLVGLYRKIPQDAAFNRFSYPNYLDVRGRNHAFSDLAAYVFVPLSLSGGAGTERAWGKLVTANYFTVLGVHVARGRGFLPEEDRTPGGDTVAVISDGLFRRLFGGEEQTVGRAVLVNGTPFTIVGVAPPGFRGTEVGQVPDIYVPVSMQEAAIPGNSYLMSRGSGWLRVVGRLAPSVSVEQARAEMETLGADMKREHPDVNAAFGIAVVPSFGIHPQFRGIVQKFLVFLMSAVGLVLLVACANLAGLLLARASERGREIGIRLAMGARRGRLIRQLLTESLLLSLLGGAVGILIAPWMIDSLAILQKAGQLPSPVDLSLDRRVLGFAAFLSVLTGVLSGLAPALQSASTGVMAILKEGAPGGTRHRARLRSVFVVAQVALSLLLLIAAGLFLKSLRNAQDIDPGFRAEGLSMMSFDLGLQGYKRERGARFYEDLEEKVRNLPGVGAASLALRAPLGDDSDTTIFVDGYRSPGGIPGMVINFNIVRPDFFETMGVRLARGRAFTKADVQGSPSVVIFNETAARRLWPGSDPLGKRIRFGGEQGSESEVVGVSADGRYVTLGEDPRPFLYIPMLQSYQSSATLFVRSAGDPAATLASVERVVRSLDKDLPIYASMTMDQYLRDTLLGPRLAASALSALGFFALLMAAVGLYGVTAHAVSGRTQEFGIRIALGARPSQILGMIVRHASAQAAAGILIGAALAAIATRFLSGFLYGVSATDPATFVLTAALLAAATLLACCLPARRAMKVDPIVALRYE